MTRPVPHYSLRCRHIVVTVAMLISLLGAAANSSAQTTARTVRDRATIWRLDAPVVAAIVPVNTVLEVIGIRDGWVEVVIPPQFGGNGARGRIAPSLVQMDSTTGGTGVIGPSGSGPGTPQTPTAPGAATPAALRPFATAGVRSFTAQNSFEAIFGDSRGYLFGGGAQYHFGKGVFAQAAVDWFRRTGERVFIFDGVRFPLGIENTVSVMPVHAAAGYRWAASNGIAPYGGAGWSLAFVRQTSEFDAEDERYSERTSGFHVVGGVEVRAGRSTWIGGEVLYLRLQNAIGTGGVSTLFAENDLGGIQAQVKVIFGR